MWTNLAILVFVGLQVLFFGTQGLFSALIHLIVVFVAAALAFAIWEPLTLGFLIERMPETAWGVGLLAPFVISGLILRVAVDKLSPGNVHFPQAVNYIAGGLLGFVAGNLVAGLTVIGVQFLGGVDLQYTPFAINERGEVERRESLWLASDEMAAAVFGAVNHGAFAPLSGHTLGTRHGDLAEAAGAFARPARPAARRSIRPANVEVQRLIHLTRPQLVGAIEDLQLPAEALPGFDDELIAVETQINLAGAGEGPPPTDEDGRFTAAPSQIALIARDADGRIAVFYPQGLVVNRTYGSFDPVAYPAAASTPALSNQTFTWVFDVPADFQPRWFRLKQAPFAVPAEPAPTEAAMEWLRTVTRQPEANGAGDAGGPPDNGGATRASVDGIEIDVTDRLPERLSANWFGPTLEREERGLQAVNESINVRDNQRVQGAVVVDHFQALPGTVVVRATMTREQFQGFGSTLARAIQLAEDLNPPLLVAETGNEYRARGYVVYDGSNRMYLNFPGEGQTIRALSGDRIRRMDADDKLYLYFHVGQGVRLTEFRAGGEAHPIDILAR